MSSTRPLIAGLTITESAATHEFCEFLREAVDAYDAIMAWRKGSGPVPVPWPAWVKAVPPEGLAPDIARRDWEDISAEGKALLEPLFDPYQRLDKGSYADPAYPHHATAEWLRTLILGHQKAYRLVRYAWYDTFPRDFRRRMDDWAARTRAHLDAVPLANVEA